MIKVKDKLFHLTTSDTSYLFYVNQYAKLIHLYYGPIVEDEDIDALSLHPILQVGSSVHYATGDETSSMDQQLLEYSEPQVGDYRVLASDIWVDDQQATDFKYVGYEILDMPEDEQLPRGHGASKSLRVILKDSVTDVRVDLVYTVFTKCNVISRYVEVEYEGQGTCTLENLSSLNLDMMNRNFELMSFHGGWIKETHAQKEVIGIGRKVISSTTTSSSNQHHPGFLLAARGSTENTGLVYGFNLIYSGNHKSQIELTPHNMLRITMGINDEQFTWNLTGGEKFSSPSAVLTVSDQGFNGASQNFHQFVNQSIVSQGNTEKLIAYNHWEATFFDYNEKKLLKLAREAKDLGMEMFVIDDGWFADRNDDRGGLSNYEVDARKFPRGLKSTVNKIKKMGLKVGLWFEPEMISVKSKLYALHPEYALTSVGRDLRYGRNQLVLDLSNPEVCDYIVDNVGAILDSCSIDYVKWDMNRHISDQRGKGYSHRYILGLYSVLKRIFKRRPHITLETCSSGGDRFDLGMLSYGSLVWASDDTDPIERLKIQEGLSYLYPLSTISAHVASSVSQQTLRTTPLSTRYNVACFGVLGYELDLTHLTLVEKKEIKDQIEFYKENRRLFQYGTFWRHNRVKDNLVSWQVSLEGKAIVGMFQTLAQASPSGDVLRVAGLQANTKYQVIAKGQRVMIDRFKQLVKHIVPLDLNPNGGLLNTVNKVYALSDQEQSIVASGKLLAFGVHLNSQFLGTGYHKDLRLWGDFGSTLYIIKEMETHSESHTT